MDSIDLHSLVQGFLNKWAPLEPEGYDKFVTDLRHLLESYGKATLRHQSLPDSEHEHGEPVE